MKTLSLVSLCLCLFSGMAFAGKGNAQQGAAVQGLTFEDLKAACLNPARFHNQIAPSNIQISCNDVQSKWVPNDQGALPMATGHLVTASIASDKYTTNTVSASVPSAQQVMACPQFKEVTETVDSVRAVTCEDIAAFNGTVTDFCASAANSARVANPQSIQSADTGRAVSLCGATVQSANAQRGQRY